MQRLFEFANVLQCELVIRYDEPEYILILLCYTEKQSMDLYTQLSDHPFRYDLSLDEESKFFKLTISLTGTSQQFSIEAAITGLNHLPLLYMKEGRVKKVTTGYRNTLKKIVSIPVYLKLGT